MPELILFSLGPVQEFIATARRSRDLWFGSWMLSELSKAAARALREIANTQLIFPASIQKEDLTPGSALNVANKIMAVVEQAPTEIADIVYKSALKRLHELRDIAYGSIQSPHFHQDIAMRQIDDLLEFYWVSVPYQPEKHSYCRRQAEALLAARKNSRNFQQFRGAMVPKSSLDASRESVIDEKAYPDNRYDNAETQKEKIALLFKQFGAKRGERLSGVDLLKRLGSGKPFPSTSAVAAAPFLSGLGDDGARLLKALIGYMKSEMNVNVFGNGEELLFPARVREFLTDENVLQAQAEIEKILTEYAQKRRPSPYYAILAADGDSIGEKLDALTSLKGNQNFSREITSFSVDARKIINAHGGTPIYLGGDDILAYLPLHTALACLNDLQDKFGSAIVGATLSGGLAIAHHLQPLSEALALAREAEKKAKSVTGKQALCVALNKRSGAERHITDRWYILNNRLQDMINLYLEKKIGKGAAHELQSLYRRLEGADLPKEALQKEALRIFKRKNEAGGGKKLSDDVVRQLQHWLNTTSGQELALEMIVAATLANAIDIAARPSFETDSVMKEAQA